MVEINNQCKAFSICWRGRGGIRIMTPKIQKSWLWRHCRRRVIYWLPDHPSQTCHAKPKTQNQQAPDATSFFLLVGCPPQAAWPERLSPKSQDAVLCSRLRSVALSPMIDRGDIRQAIDRCSNIIWSLPGAGYGQFEHKADSLIAKFKEAGVNGQRDWREQSHRDYLRSGRPASSSTAGC